MNLLKKQNKKTSSSEYQEGLKLKLNALCDSGFCLTPVLALFRLLYISPPDKAFHFIPPAMYFFLLILIFFLLNPDKMR